MSTDRSAESVERVLAAIRAAHARNPHLRVGQIVARAAAHCDVPVGRDGDLFYVENADLAAALEKMK